MMQTWSFCRQSKWVTAILGGRLCSQNKSLSDALKCKVIAEKAKNPSFYIKLPGCSNIFPSLLCSTAFTLNMLDAAGNGKASTNIYIYNIYLYIISMHTYLYIFTNVQCIQRKYLVLELKGIFHQKEFPDLMDTCSYTDIITYKTKRLLTTVIQFKGIMQPVFTVFPLHKSMILKTN